MVSTFYELLEDYLLDRVLAFCKKNEVIWCKENNIMANLINRYLIATLLLIVTAFVIHALEYGNFKDDETSLTNLQGIPMQIGRWMGEEVSLDEMVYEILETRAIIHRSFTADKVDNVFLSIVHYHDTKVDFHSPEACLGGIGDQIQKTTKKLTLFSGGRQKTIVVAKMLASGETGQTLVYYFFKSGQFMGSNYIKMRLSIAANKLAAKDTKGSLIRISTKLTPGREAAAESLLIDFLENLLPHIQESL